MVVLPNMVIAERYDDFSLAKDYRNQSPFFHPDLFQRDPDIFVAFPRNEFHGFRFAADKPDLSSFPDRNVILSTGDAPTVSANGLEKNADERRPPASV